MVVTGTIDRVPSRSIHESKRRIRSTTLLYWDSMKKFTMNIVQASLYSQREGFNSRTPGNNGLAVSVLCDYMMSVRFLIQV